MDYDSVKSEIMAKKVMILGVLYLIMLIFENFLYILDMDGLNKSIYDIGSDNAFSILARSNKLISEGKRYVWSSQMSKLW